MNDDIYDHLSAYGFDTLGQVAQRLFKLSDAELTQFFTIYKIRAENHELIIAASMGQIDIYPDSWDASLPPEVVKQLALYANRVYLHDPLLELAVNWKHYKLDLSMLVQYGTEEERTRHYLWQVTEAIELLLALRPLVKAGIVHFTPTFLVQNHRNPGDIYTDDFYGNEVSAKPLDLPPAFRQYIRDHLKVVPAQYRERTPVLFVDKTLTPRNTIALFFEGDPSPRIQLLGDTSVSDTEEGVIHMHYSLEEQQPDEVMFWNWIEGTKRQAIVERLGRLQLDILLAETARAKFLTSLPASKDLAQLGIPNEGSTKADVLTALLKMELPYFNQATFSSIAQARQNEEAFEEFRGALNAAFQEINKASSPREAQDRMQEITRDLILRPVAKIDQRMKSMRRNLFPEALILLGSLTSTIIMQGNALAGGALLATSTIYGGAELLKARKARREQREQIEQLPHFYYWEATHPNERKRQHSFLPLSESKKVPFSQKFFK